MQSTTQQPTASPGSDAIASSKFSGTSAKRNQLYAGRTIVKLHTGTFKPYRTSSADNTRTPKVYMYLMIEKGQIAQKGHIGSKIDLS